MLVAIGVEDDRALAELLLQAIGIELRLLLSYPRISAGPLGLDQPERLAIIAPEYIIDKPFARSVWHPCDGEFRVLTWISEGPSGLAKQQVNERVAGRRLVIIVRVGGGRVCLFGRGYLGAQSGDLGFERGTLRLAGKPFLLC